MFDRLKELLEEYNYWMKENDNILEISTKDMVYEYSAYVIYEDEKYIVKEKDMGREYINFTYVNEDEMTVYTFFYVLQRLDPEELQIKYIEYEEIGADINDIDTADILLRNKLIPYKKSMYGTEWGCKLILQDNGLYGVRVKIGNENKVIAEDRELDNAIIVTYNYSFILNNFNTVFEKHGFDPKYENTAKDYYLFGCIVL